MSSTNSQNKGSIIKMEKRSLIDNTLESNLGNRNNPDSIDDFYFQWHITDRCNLRCSHCYQNDYSNSTELTYEELKSIADKMNQALTKWKREGRVAITGGEPFIRKDLLNLLNYLEKQPSIKKIGILTNGILLNGLLNSLKEISKLYYIQISLEGNKAINDKIRGNGVFEKVIESTRQIKNAGISIRWMVTLHKNNVSEVPEIIDLALTNDVDVITFERLIPTGSGKYLEDIILTPDDLSMAFNDILKRSDNEYSKGSKLMIQKCRTLWILTDPERSEKSTNIDFQKEVGASCSIGMDSLCVLPDATVLPCRRLPIPIGNLKNNSMFDIWYTSQLLWKIRNKENLKGKCNNCEYIARCGGCRAMAYAVTGDYLEEDPQCWK